MGNCGCENKGRATNRNNTCLDCDVGPFARNNYFTGKLLVERDFKDEQAYYMDKALLHNRQLHGCGVVCGLRVTQHEAENCRTRYLCIEPGTAVDCCGHEIIVPERECIEIAQLDAVRQIKAEQDANGQPVLHRVQICLRYRECPTEDIPVLYGECGCDDAACAPNRVLESYDVDALVDEPDETPALFSPRFERKFTIPLDQAVSVALDEAGGSLYVLAGETGGTISRVKLDDGTISPQSRSMPAGQRCERIALSADCTRLYAVLEPATAGDPLQIAVIDTNDLAGAAIRMVDLPDSANGTAYMALAGGRLLTLAVASGKLHVWGAALDAAPAIGDPPLTPESTVDLGVVGPLGLAVASNGKGAYTVDPDPAAHRVLVADLSVSPPVKGADLDLQAGGAVALDGSPMELAVVKSSGPDRLAVITSGGELRLLAINPAAVLGTTTGLTGKPTKLAVSPDGQWAYILETNAAGDRFFQAVNLYRLGLSQATTPGAPFSLDPGARDPVISSDGGRLYVPYTGTAGPPPVSGGVALVDITEQDCQEILWRHLDGCPSCEDGACECVVLATIENYAPGFAIWDAAVPPRPDEDKANKIARIDNRKGRRLLPSTQTLLELIECALDKAPGGEGKQGPPGEPGPGIDHVQVTTVPCGQQPADPQIIQGPNGRTLVLELPSELDNLNVEVQPTKCSESPSGEIICDNDQRKLVLHLPPGLKDLKVEINSIECGKDAQGNVVQDDLGQCKLVLDIPTACKALDLPHIVAINWPHDATLLIQDQATQKLMAEFDKNGIVIAFDAEMLPETINRHTIQVLFSVDDPNADGYCFCNLQGHVSPGRVITDKHGEDLPACGDVIKAFIPFSDADIKAGKPATGAQFRPIKQDWIKGGGTEYQVIAKGDFILALKEDPDIKLADGKPGHRALDGNHLGPGLPLRCPTGDGVEGGTFESWFGIFREKPDFLKLDLNVAQPDDLLNLRGIGPAMLRRIEAARNDRPFTGLQDFRDRVALSDRDWERIRTDVTIVPRG